MVPRCKRRRRCVVPATVLGEIAVGVIDVPLGHLGDEGVAELIVPRIDLDLHALEPGVRRVGPSRNLLKVVPKLEVTSGFRARPTLSQEYR